MGDTAADPEPGFVQADPIDIALNLLNEAGVGFNRIYPDGNTPPELLIRYAHAFAALSTAHAAREQAAMLQAAAAAGQAQAVALQRLVTLLATAMGAEKNEPSLVVPRLSMTPH